MDRYILILDPFDPDKCTYPLALPREYKYEMYSDRKPTKERLTDPQKEDILGCIKETRRYPGASDFDILEVKKITEADC